MLWLDVAFVIALLVQLSKGADLLLRPHQQRWVQKVAEDTTLRLTYMRPLTWFSRVITVRSMQLLLAMGTALFGTLLAHAGWRMLRFNSGGAGSASNWILGSTLFLGFLGVLYLVRTLGAVSNRWLFEHGTWWRFLTRYFILYIAMIGVMVALAPLQFLLFTASQAAPSSTTATVSMALAWTVFVVFFSIFTFIWLLLMTGSVVILFQLLILVLLVTIPGVRALMWRVVEYNKGAWAAVSLVTTVVLGVAALAFRTNQ